MKRDDPILLGDIIQEMLGDGYLGRGLKAATVFDAWNKVLGESVAVMSSRKEFENGHLKVHISSPLVRNQLMMQQSLIVSRLNECLGRPLVKSIIIL